MIPLWMKPSAWPAPRLASALVAAALSCAAAHGWAGEGPPGGSLRVDAEVAEGGGISGHVTARWEGDPCGGAPAQVDWLLPPERFAAPPEVGGELLARRISPGRFDPGAMAVWDAAGAPLPPPPGSPGLFAEGPAEEVDGGLGAQVAFTAHVPRRFGIFGDARGQLTLQGGWFPEPRLRCDGAPVPDPPGSPRFDVALRLRLPEGWWALVGRGVHPPAEGGPTQASADLTGVDLVTVVAGPRLRLIPLQRAPDVTLLGAHVGRRQRRGLDETLADALAVWALLGLPEVAAPPVVALAPDRRSLAREGGG